VCCAIYDIQDAFLKYWFAIETLGTNKTSINKFLSEIYENSLTTIDKFMISKIYTLRSKAAHGGMAIPNHSFLLQYLEALYIGLFLEILELPAQYRADKILTNSDFDVRAYIEDLLSKR
jgi:hypothetical protein